MRFFLILIVTILYMNGTQAQNIKPLNDLEKKVIEGKETEAPFTGKYYKFKEKGTYNCRKCGAVLYRSSDKFESECGWPSFDDEIPGAVTRKPDTDGMRTEITCANCGGHLGHVFTGERLTKKNIRHCVNSVSLEFVPEKRETAIFAGGCFWGVEHLLRQVKGVLSVESGYTGGKTSNPTYEEICSGETGHAEAVEVVFDANQVSYEKVAKYFFEIHDPTQTDRQGPDIGTQYRSEIFYTSEEQKNSATRLINLLKSKGYKVATKVTKAAKFYPAEKYHQDYYLKKGTQPYCHSFIKRF